jgi:hypothetical protein
MIALLFVIAAQPAPPEATIEDARRFAQHDLAGVRKKYQITQFYSCYLSELLRSAPDRTTERRLDEERDTHRRKAMRIYRDLETLVSPQASDLLKLRSLRNLQYDLGEKAFLKGEVPPPVPAKREKDFNAWLDKKLKEGFKTPGEISKAVLREKEEKRKREQQKK